MKLDTIAIIAAAGLGLFLLSQTLRASAGSASISNPGTASSLNNGGAMPVFGLPMYGAITPYGMASFGDDPYGLGAIYGTTRTTTDSNPFNAYIK